MFWYIRIGRFIYGILFALALIITFLQIIQRRSGVFIAVVIDVTLALIGVALESTYMSYRERGTVYVETGESEDSFNLAQYHTNNENYFVAESMGEYFVKLSGKRYLKSYKKREVTIEENPQIGRPVIEIITTEKISKPADNEYSIFALIGDKVKTEKSKIIVKNRAEDIRKNKG